jgi:hypothetical protein
MGDSRAIGAFTLSPSYVDMDPLPVTCALSKGVNPCLRDLYPRRDADLASNEFRKGVESEDTMMRPARLIS